VAPAAPDPVALEWQAAVASGQMYRINMLEGLIGTSATFGPCLQIGLGRGFASGFAPNWTVVDLYDPSPGVHFRYDVAALPADWTNRFEFVICNAVLEHVPNPREALAELHRVMKPGGRIWCEVPFMQQFHVSTVAAEGGPYHMGGDFWRVTVPGMRVWMANWEEIRCDWAADGVVFFHGRKAGPPDGGRRDGPRGVSDGHA
jgi:SAM-dependent methyltransferase